MSGQATKLPAAGRTQPASFGSAGQHPPPDSAGDETGGGNVFATSPARPLAPSCLHPSSRPWLASCALRLSSTPNRCAVPFVSPRHRIRGRPARWCRERFSVLRSWAGCKIVGFALRLVRDYEFHQLLDWLATGRHLRGHRHVNVRLLWHFCPGGSCAEKWRGGRWPQERFLLHLQRQPTALSLRPQRPGPHHGDPGALLNLLHRGVLTQTAIPTFSMGSNTVCFLNKCFIYFYTKDWYIYTRNCLTHSHCRINAHF